MAYRIEVAILQFCPPEEKAPQWDSFVGLINYSKIQMDKNQTQTPTREGKIEQQKSRLLKSGFLNGRQSEKRMNVLICFGRFNAVL